MIPVLSAATAELAEAALGCVPLARALKLAEWIGAGRQLTSSGVLKPALAIEACRVLGIAVPAGRLRSALDVDELMEAWQAACFAGYIAPRGSRVRATGRAADTSPQSVLQSWLNAVCAELGLPDEPCAGCLTVLHELNAADGAVTLSRLAEAVRSLQPPGDQDGACPACGEVHDSPGPAVLFGDEDDDLDDGLEHAEGAVMSLMSYGAATASETASSGDGPGEAIVRLTPLGRMLADSVFAGCAPPPDADAATLIGVLGAVPPRIAAQMAAPWLAARSPAAAVRELLGYAEQAGPAQRMVAMAFAMGIGPEAVPAWREWADRPGAGAYARMWLAEHGEEAPAHPDDQAWLTVEAFSAADSSVPPGLLPLVLAAALADADSGEAAEALAQMSGSGHPDAARLVGSVSAATGVRPSSRARPRDIPAGDVYQLKITLRGVSKPPVWRRVTVPAGLTLDLLHQVIMDAMGWDDAHLHVFTTAWGAEYGLPDAELGHGNERDVTLREVLPRPGDEMRYTYDFGDGWEHVIVLEEVHPAGRAAASLSCLAGKGACPPEDCGGAWGYADLKRVLADPDDEEHQDVLEWLGLDAAAGFDPARFSLDQVNAQLSHLQETGTGVS